MKLIPLTQGKFTMVDDEDFEWLNKYKWYFGGRRYAIKGINHSHKIYMHRLIMKPPIGMQIDHINRNELDNRKCNLRICTIRQNQFNTKLRKDNKSGYKGVYLRNRDKKWVVYLGGKFFGTFINKKEAAKTYNKAAIRYYGKFASLNIL